MNGTSSSSHSEEQDNSDESSPSKAKLEGFLMECDAARKIAQGLGSISKTNFAPIIQNSKKHNFSQGYLFTHKL
jgi:hypothetical protein